MHKLLVYISAHIYMYVYHNLHLTTTPYMFICFFNWTNVAVEMYNVVMEYWLYHCSLHSTNIQYLYMYNMLEISALHSFGRSVLRLNSYKSVEPSYVVCMYMYMYVHIS